MKKLLFITSRFPYPLDKGDKLRVFHQLKGLRSSFEVHLIALNNEGIDSHGKEVLAPYCKSCHVIPLTKIEQTAAMLSSFLKRTPLQVAFFWSKRANNKVQELISTIQPDLIHCHLIRTFPYVKNLHYDILSVDLMDAFAEGMSKRQNQTNNIFKKALFSHEKRLLQRLENQVISRSNKLCIISEQDRDYLIHENKGQIQIVPNGVDFKQFYPKTCSKKFDLIFMGNLGYPPNIEAIEYFVSKIYPIIIQKRPQTTLLIAGVNPTKKICSLENDLIKVQDDFTDISDAIAVCRIMIAPMIISIGLQNKIIQAMAMKVPCVVTTAANKPIMAKSNDSIAVADQPLEFAVKVIGLLNDEEKRELMGQKAYEFVKSEFSWSNQNDKLIKMLES